MRAELKKKHLIRSRIGHNMRLSDWPEPTSPAMNGIARITYPGGERLMPARNGYDREVVFDEAEFCARRHGQVRLELNRAAILIRVAPAEAPSICCRCSKPADRLSFALGTRTFCRRCARHATR